MHDSVSIFTQVVNRLRSQLTRLDEIKKERETLEGEIKAVTFDMSVSFLSALAQDGAINEEQLSISQLEQLYGAYNQRVQASLRAQEELLGQVQVCFQTRETMCLIRLVQTLQRNFYFYLQKSEGKPSEFQT